MNKKAFVVVGLGYGDEGKGLSTDFLCSKYDNPLVIRFNGGQQAGHTVATKHLGNHVFSNFGSGTLRKVPTYWSRYCTFSPAYFLLEYNIVPVKPIMFIDGLSPVTTHYDVLFNRAIEFTRGSLKHGSCGLGFGATVNRQKTVSLNLMDLFDKNIFHEKLRTIRLFYENKFRSETTYNFHDFKHDLEDYRFENYVKEIESLINQKVITIVDENSFFSTYKNYDTFIFEGAQGILLDINFGKWPHVTKSNTTSQNALEIIKRNFKNIDVAVVYVTRAYQTRHGAGPFNELGYRINVKNEEFETNKYNKYQGHFQIGCLNIDEINFAISCDQKFSSGIKKQLIVTCIDQVCKSNIPVIENGQIKNIHYDEIPKYIKHVFDACRFSFSNYTEDLT